MEKTSSTKAAAGARKSPSRAAAAGFRAGPARTEEEPETPRPDRRYVTGHEGFPSRKAPPT